MFLRIFLLYILFEFSNSVAVKATGTKAEDGLDVAASSTIPEVKLTCPEETFRGQWQWFGNFQFPETEAEENGKIVKAECPYGFRDDGQESIYGVMTTKQSKMEMSGATRTCLLVVENGKPRAEWNWPEIRYCRYRTTNSALTNFRDQLRETIAGTRTLDQFWPRVLTLENLAVDDYECASELVNGYASLLTSPQLNEQDAFTEADRNTIYNRLVLFINRLSSSLPPGFKIQVGSQGVAIETVTFPTTDFFARATPLLRDAKGHILNPYANTIQAVKRYETKLAPGSEIDVFVDISAEAVHKAMDQENSNSKSPQLKITAYSDEVFRARKGTEKRPATPSEICNPKPSTLEKLNMNLNSSKNNHDIPNGCDRETGENSTLCETYEELYTNRSLLCIELNGVVENLNEPVEFTIKDNFSPPDGYQTKCVYWDPENGNWSSEGVVTTQQEDGVKCSSTHLSAFSALIEPLPLPFPGADYAPINNSIHSYILSILSSIGSVCSIIGLFLTLLTFGIFRCLRRERSNRILINLSLSLLFLHIMSVSGSRNLWDDHCFVPAVSLHYLVLTSLAWMMVEAVHMFELLISVFVRPETRFLIKRIVLAWGMPLVIVAICAIVEPEVYHLGRGDLCLMSPYENIFLYYGAYIGPVCLMLLVNLVIFIRIFRVFYQQTKRTKAVANKGQGTVPKCYLVKISPSQIKGATSVLVLLGIGWILGLLAMGPFEVLFRYMYCVCNAGQGLFIFIFRVALNPQACKQWKKIIIGFPSSESSMDVSTSSNSIASGKRNLKRKSTIMTPTLSSVSNSVENSLTASNPMSATLANTIAAILKAENERVPPSSNNTDLN